ncbi:LEA type 2 family protein [bacterium SCSIO 12741]|nr:LEA type 2 family protein [bacterium SCSIO 12741]
MLKYIMPFVLLATLMTSCIDYEEVRLVSVNETDLERITPEGVVIRVKATVDNPNEYKISLNTKDLKVYLNGKYLGVANLRDKIQLKPKKVDEYEFYMVSEIPADGNIDIGTLAQGTLMGSLRLKVEGKIQAKAKGITRSIDVSFDRNLTM